MRVPIPRATSKALSTHDKVYGMYRSILRSVVAAGLGLTAGSAFAGSQTWTFDGGDTTGLAIFSNVTAGNGRSEGGNPDGYLAITDAVNSTYTGIVFPDIDGGKPVIAFNLKFDARIGNAVGNGGRPADGMSVSYARQGDKVLVDADANAGNPSFDLRGSFGVPGGPEMGTATGIVVSFDAWQGNTELDGSPDVEGLVIQVDGKVVKTVGMGTRNGACDDINSTQTGPYDTTNPGSPDGLCWAPVEVDLDATGKLTVNFKNHTYLDHYQTAFFPSAGRLVFAGRTGGANQNQHIDNLSLTTVPADKMLVGGANGNACKWFSRITDNPAAGSIYKAGTAVFKLDGNVVVPTSSDKVGDITTFTFVNPAGSFFDSGSTHRVEVSAQDEAGNTVGGARDWQVPAYTGIPAALASGIDAASSTPGWKARMYQLSYGRYPGDSNRYLNAEREIAEGYLDDTGAADPNQVDLSTAVEGNIFNVDGPINMDQGAAKQGNFGGETLFPGLASGDPNNIAGEFSGYVALPAGCYTFGVNSDDGFSTSFGRGLSDVFGLTVGRFDGGRGASDSLFSFVIYKDGLYPMRTLWWEGGGGANIEIFSVDEAGVKHLLNDPNDSASILVYRDGAAKSHIRSVMPVANQYGGSTAEAPVIIKVVDGAAAVGPITVKYDGATVSPTTSKDGSVTTLQLDFANGQRPGYHTVNVSFDDVNQSYTYNVSRLQRALGAGNFVIEAEDFNVDGTDGGQGATLNTMPYLGGALAGPIGTRGVDFGDWDGNDSHPYRTAGDGTNGGVNHDTGPQGRQNNRGSWDLTTNYKIGWIGSPDWFNYRRTVPAGNYHIVAGVSFDGTDAHQLHGRIGLMGTAGTVSEMIGTYDGIGSGGNGTWGVNSLVELKNDSGALVVYHSDGTEKNFRVYADSGDFDYWAFIPTDEAPNGTTVKTTGVFYIEAEDYNFGRGQTIAGASVMPYYGGAFVGGASSAAIEDIDIGNRDDDSSNSYNRDEQNQDGGHANINITGQGDLGRDGWTMQENYRIGWVGGGDWQNYTRTFPAGKYNVWAALSFGDTSDHSEHGTLSVVTSDPSQPNQTLQKLGTFDASGSGGWGNNTYVQLMDDSGAPAVVTLGGTMTLRATIDSGDFDYLKFVPASGCVTPTFSSIKLVSNGTAVQLNWNGNATLEVADELTGPWTVVPGAASGLTAPVDRAHRFARLKCAQ